MSNTSQIQLEPSDTNKCIKFLIKNKPASNAKPMLRTKETHISMGTCMDIIYSTPTTTTTTTQTTTMATTTMYTTDNETEKDDKDNSEEEKDKGHDDYKAMIIVVVAEEVKNLREIHELKRDPRTCYILKLVYFSLKNNACFFGHSYCCCHCIQMACGQRLSMPALSPCAG